MEMPVLINFKICDNAKECYGIEVCSTGAFHWDKKNKTIAVNESKCILCGKCEKACEVGAIRVAKTDEEFKKIKKEIDEDPRKASDLFVDRYGAEPVHPAYLVPKKEFRMQILDSTKLVALELFNSDSINCLLYSIPVKELFKGMDLKYRKMEVKESFLKKYKVKKLPSLLFFRNGKLVGKIEGYFDEKKEKKLKKKIGKILVRIKN